MELPMIMHLLPQFKRKRKRLAQRQKEILVEM